MNIEVHFDPARPITALIERIADAIGVVYEPTRIRRRAGAEADAERIHALGRAETRQALAQLDLPELEKRTLSRLLAQESRRQKNMDAIVEGAVDQLGADAHPENLDIDWLANYLDKASRVSDREMQTLWSRILAGEATNAGRYSKRTLEIVSTLSKEDAAMFTQLCSFVADIGGDYVPLIYVNTAIQMYQPGITFGLLAHLDYLGLIQLDLLNQNFVLNFTQPEIQGIYLGTQFSISFQAQAPQARIRVGAVLLTQAGVELAPISGAQPHADFLTYLRNAVTQGGGTLAIVE